MLNYNSSAVPICNFALKLFFLNNVFLNFMNSKHFIKKNPSLRMSSSRCCFFAIITIIVHIASVTLNEIDAVPKVAYPSSQSSVMKNVTRGQM